MLLSNMILAGMDTLPQLPHQLLKSLDSSFGLEGTFLLWICILFTYPKRPCLEYCSHVWGAAPPSTLSILDSIQRKAIRLIDDQVLSGRLPSLVHRRAVGDFSLFYRYFHRLCSEGFGSIILQLAFRSRVTREALHIHLYTVQLQKPRISHYLRSFVAKVSRLCNLLPSGIFPSSPNLQFFQSHINKLPLPSFQTPTMR